MKISSAVTAKGTIQLNKKLTGLLDELSNYAPRRDRDLFIEGRAQQVIASASHLIQLIEENYDELKALAADKIRTDSGIPIVSRIPGYDKVVGQASESVMHVLIAMLADPRMDEFVSDLLRNNLEQIQSAVRRREHERTGSFRQAGAPAAAAVADAAASRPPSDDV